MASTLTHSFAIVSLAALAVASWLDPGPDVSPNPLCDPASVTPAIDMAADVTELHPGHVRYVLGIGDSMTAAALANGGPFEYRQESWSTGVGGNGSYTMPYLLQQYARTPLVGPAKGSRQTPQLAPCCGMAPWWSGFMAGDDQLNVALSGAESGDWILEVQHLTDLVTGKGFGTAALGGFPKWSVEQQEVYNSSWKVLTIFLGMNDVLTSHSACSENESAREAIVTSFRGRMTELLEHLLENRDGVFSKLYVNLGSLFAVSNLGLKNAEEGLCKATGGVLKSEFPCMRNGGDLEAKGKLVDEVIGKANKVLVELAGTYDMRRPDFGINLVRTSENQQISHRDYRVELDCFHPSAKAHRVFGTGLWNAMLKPSIPTPLDDLENVPSCADANTRLVTYSQFRASSSVLV